MSSQYPIAVVEPRGAIAVLRPDGERLLRTEIVARGFHPTWNPVRPELAVGILHEGGTSSSTELYEAAGNYLRTLHRSAPGLPPVIAPRLPQYLSWSPRGDRLAIIAPSAGALSLYLSDADGAMLSDPVVSGAPLFPVWSPDGRYLAVHAATELSVIDVESRRPVEVIGGRVAGFRTPAYSPNGSALVYATAGDNGVAVHRASADGSNSKEIANFPGGVALAFRTTNELTVAVTLAPDTGNFDQLWAIDLETLSRTQLARGPIVSFSWSPRGDRFVTCVPAQTGDGRFQLQSRFADGSFCGASEPFVPSIDYRTVLGFFDQYGTSHRQWAPDGSAVVVAGRLANDGISAAFGDPEGGYAFRWAAERGAPLELLAPADFATYPPVSFAIE